MSISKAFELAVKEFVASLCPSAHVIHNHKVPDRDTGRLRQVDVWVEGTIANHFPFAILISCKHHKRPLGIGHIESIIGEIESTGASTGILYSSSGFSRTAVKKAKSHGIPCCRLYRGESPDLPTVIAFPIFLCQPLLRFDVEPSGKCLVEETWNDVFDSTITCESPPITVLDLISRRILDQQRETIRSISNLPHFPDRLCEIIELENRGQNKVLRIRTVIEWKKFKGLSSAHRASGSYCFNNQSFSGTIASPFIAMREAHPGEGWEEITDNKFQLPIRCLIMFRIGDFRDEVKSIYGSKRLCDAEQ